MDNFAGNNGVIQTISAEFTGPLHFMQFWVETIKQWEATHKKKEIICLGATKDVQDAILADPAKASVINLIDIRYWYLMRATANYMPRLAAKALPRARRNVSINPKHLRLRMFTMRCMNTR